MFHFVNACFLPLANDRRFVVSNSIYETPDGLYLQVSSTVIWQNPRISHHDTGRLWPPDIFHGAGVESQMEW